MQEIIKVNNGLQDRTPTTADRVLSLHGDCVVETFVIGHTLRLVICIQLHRIAFRYVFIHSFIHLHSMDPYMVGKTSGYRNSLIDLLLNCMYQTTFLDTGETEISGTACEIL
jgi:hypothetical protein